jgi:hypothetical protein
MGNDNHVVVSHKLFDFQGCVGGCIVVMKEPVVVVPKFQSFSSHIFSRVSQNVTVQVKVRVDHSVRRNKFTVTIPFMSKKTTLLNSGHATPFLLLVIMGSSTATVVALFLNHNCTSKSNFRHPLEIKVGSLLAFSCSSRHMFKRHRF